VNVALVLGGGGLKGFAHLGVLQALQEMNVRPAVHAGTSIGALIAAAHVGGSPLDELADRAKTLRQRDLFQIDHIGMVTRRMRNASLYLEKPLRRLVEELVPDGTFDDFASPLLINSVDLERGEQVVFGLPGLRDVSVRDAVYASCALPGFFPPGKVGRITCVDGGVMDNVPARAASMNADVVIAVDVGSSSIAISRGVNRDGFAAIYERSAQVMMHELQHGQLALWDGPPLLFVRPKVWHFNWFSFGKASQFIEAGYHATVETLAWLDDALAAGSGVYPRRQVRLTVDPEKCTGCTLCASLARPYMEMAPNGKARPTADVFTWSRADGGFVQQCPTNAITASVEEHGLKRESRQLDAIND
jgi:NTE family protein